ncbi:hypothetical protein B0H14DRAFT_2931218, partial [Mycena olivaceomarginata]
MHFSKTYSQLLQELPPELSENALKKVINQLVAELESLGLGPTSSNGKSRETSTRVEYEFNSASGRIEPRLRLWVDPPNAPSPPSRSRVEEVDQDDEGPELSSESQVSLLWALQRHVDSPDVPAAPIIEPSTVDDVIPLVSDSAFFELLVTALQGLSAHLLAIHAQFVETLAELTRSVSDSARPVSSTSHSFKAHSPWNSDAGGVRVDASSRKIFQLYVEAECFESVNEQTRGERTIEETEDAAEAVCGTGDGQRARRWAQLKLPQSRKALESFLQLNIFILNVKKFELANAEATRKNPQEAYEAHRPALDRTPVTPPPLDLLPANNTSLPRILVQELGTTLLPIIPSLDDYDIAFKPIRLSCGHLFCVRCLVKMQKRGNAHCPMCRAPCVLIADRSNVDWALLNFMRDWFPEEASVKLRQNEKEAALEQLEELGVDPNARCTVM